MTRRPTDRTDSRGPAAALPLSRPFAVDRLRHGEDVDFVVEADAAERAGLARIDDLVGIERLTGRFRIAREGAAGVHVVGDVDAEVIQTCVVTLEPFAAAVREAVDLHFVPEAESAAAEAAAIRAGADDEIDVADVPDPPDPIVDGRIDLGAITAEFLTLGLDPYPRKPGASFDATGFELPAEGQPASPFAALQRLRDRKG
jgi:uncharacterized metal-binding protein YceD (DUF177 family)